MEQAEFRMLDAYKIFPFYPDRVLLSPLYDDFSGKYAMMINEMLPSGRPGQTLFATTKAVFDNEEQAVFSTSKMLKMTMQVVKISMN